MKRGNLYHCFAIKMTVFFHGRTVELFYAVVAFAIFFRFSFFRDKCKKTYIPMIFICMYVCCIPPFVLRVSNYFFCFPSPFFFPLHDVYLYANFHQSFKKHLKKRKNKRLVDRVRKLITFALNGGMPCFFWLHFAKYSFFNSLHFDARMYVTDVFFFLVQRKKKVFIKKR